MERGAWQVTVHGVAKESDMTEQPNSNKEINRCVSSDRNKVNCINPV